MQKMDRYFPAEIGFSAAMLLLMVALSIWFDLPIIMPTSKSVTAVGIHYLAPVVAIVVWGACVAASRQHHSWRTLLLALPCYGIVLWVHFNIKLWVPLLNPVVYDAALWRADQVFRPVVELCFHVREMLRAVLPDDRGLYLVGFIMLFYLSFCYHGIFTPKVFRKLLLSALFIQGFGAILYALVPALGPFIFEAGVNPVITNIQGGMLDLHQQIVAGGGAWLAGHGSHVLFAGLGAMPSLHVGSSFLFLWFAIRHGRKLLTVYIPIFGYIVVTSIANRWHYLLDLPVGIALAYGSIYLAGLFTAEAEEVVEVTDGEQKAPAVA